MTAETTTTDLAELGRRYLLDPEFRNAPGALFERLLADGRVLPVGGGLWLVAGFHEASTGLRDARFSRTASGELEMDFMLSAADEQVRHAGACVMHSMMMLDPPEHSRVRKFFRAPFLPRAVAAWRADLERLCDRLLDAIPRDRVVDLKAAYAHPLPQQAMCRILGVPYEDDEKFLRWGEAIVNVDRSGGASDESLAPSRQANVEFCNYLGELIARRRAEPVDDFLGGLIDPHEDGDRLSDEELIGNLLLLVIAGHETTANTIVSAVLLLMQHPEQWRRLVADPGLASAVVEETLRLHGAQRFNAPRVALEDVELGGHVIPKGDRVFFLTQVINRDPGVFIDPATFDIDREPNSHMAFGFGPHVCLGMHLARLEMIVALEALARRCPDLDLAVEPGELRGVTSPTLLGWESLPVRVGSEARS